MKKLSGRLLTLVIIISVVFAFYFFNSDSFQSRQLEPQITVKPTITTPTKPLVGGDQDEHGCKGSAGYTWCEEKKECIRPWETPCTSPSEKDEDILPLIKQSLIKKNDWQNGDDIVLTVSKREGNFVKGSVSEKNANTGGGLFFAVKKNEVWEIVADGNGIITCDSLLSYPDYPVSLIPECWDEKGEVMVKR